MPNQMILATMDASFAAWFSSFEECADVDIAQLALQAIFNDEIYAANKDNFDRNDLTTVIDKFKEILRHTCPQNRNVSLAVYNFNPNRCLYKIRAEDIKDTNQEDQKYLLHNGCEVLFSDCHCVNLGSNEADKCVLASEPMGLLGLSKYGPVAKEDVVTFIREKCDSTKYELEARDEKLNSLVANLLSGLTTCEKASQEIELTLQQLVALSGPEKEIIARKLCYFFHADSNAGLRRQPNETAQAHSERVISAVTERISENRAVIEAEKLQTAEFMESLKAFNGQAQVLADSLEAKIVNIVSSGCFDPKVKLESRKHKFLSFLLNYNVGNPRPYGVSVEMYGSWTEDQICKSYGFFEIPGAAFWQSVSEYKEIKEQIAQFKESKPNSPVRKGAERKGLAQREGLYRQWFKFLRLGKFEEARSIEDKYAKAFRGKFDFKATDEFGKSPFYYALVNGNDAFLCRLVLSAQITLSEEDKLAASIYRKDVKHAIDTNLWDSFLDKRIKKDIENLLRDGCQEKLGNIYKRYADEGFVQVYDGHEFRGRVSDVLKQVVRDLEDSFKGYHYGWVAGSLEFYQNAFLKLGEDFGKAKSSACELDSFVLSDYFKKLTNILDEPSVKTESAKVYLTLKEKLEALLPLLQKHAAELGKLKGRFSRLGNVQTYQKICPIEQVKFEAKLWAVFRQAQKDNLIGECKELFRQIFNLNNLEGAFETALLEQNRKQEEVGVGAPVVPSSAASSAIPVQAPAGSRVGDNHLASPVAQAQVNSEKLAASSAPSVVPARGHATATSRGGASDGSLAASSMFSSQSKISRGANMNFLTGDVSGDNLNLAIPKQVLFDFLSANGLYATTRNKGYWFEKGKDGSKTIMNLRTLIQDSTVDDKLSLAQIRSAITKNRKLKNVDFSKSKSACGTNRVLSALNDEFNRVANPALPANKVQGI